MTHAALDGSRSPYRPALVRGGRAACLALALVLLPGWAAADGLGVVTASRLGNQFAKGDCAGAAASLNVELAKKSTKAYLLAGSMYEHGICLVRDWSRAMAFYEQAHDGGEKAAAWRLASGFAAPENGPDIAAALWWAGKAGQELVKDCSAGAVDDPDRFVEQLRGWSKQRLEQCNYVVGVMSTIVGELRYPRNALVNGLEGDMTLRFLPAVPALEMKMRDSEQYRVLARPNGTLPSEGPKAKGAGAVFENMVRQVAQRALERYPQPPGIPADAVAPLRLKFELTLGGY